MSSGRTTYLLDCKAASEEGRSTNLPHFEGISFECSAVSIGSRPISKIDNQSNQNENGISWCPFLPLSCRDEQVSTSMGRLLQFCLSTSLELWKGRAASRLYLHQQNEVTKIMDRLQKSITLNKICLRRVNEGELQMLKSSHRCQKVSSFHTMGSWMGDT